MITYSLLKIFYATAVSITNITLPKIPNANNASAHWERQQWKQQLALYTSNAVNRENLGTPIPKLMHMNAKCPHAFRAVSIQKGAQRSFARTFKAKMPYYVWHCTNVPVMSFSLWIRRGGFKRMMFGCTARILYNHKIISIVNV